MLYCEGCGQIITDLLKALFNKINEKGIISISDDERWFITDALHKRPVLVCPICGDIMVAEEHWKNAIEKEDE